MREAKDALAILANRRTQKAHARDPNAYHATVLRQLKADRWDEALELAKDGMSAPTIADVLADRIPTAPGPYDGWKGAPEHEAGVGIERALERIAEIRRALEEQRSA